MKKAYLAPALRIMLPAALDILAASAEPRPGDDPAGDQNDDPAGSDLDWK